MSSIEPGWYPDPSDAEIEWYWDGEKWSGESREYGESNYISPAVDSNYRDNNNPSENNSSLSGVSSWSSRNEEYNSINNSELSNNDQNSSISDWSSSPNINPTYLTKGSEHPTEDFLDTPYQIRKKDENKLRKKPLPVRLIVSIIIFLSITIFFIVALTATKKIKTQESVFGPVKVTESSKPSNQVNDPINGEVSKSETPKKESKITPTPLPSKTIKEKKAVYTTPAPKASVTSKASKSSAPKKTTKITKSQNSSNAVTSLNSSFSNKSLVVSWLDPINPSAGRVLSYTVKLSGGLDKSITVTSSSAIFTDVSVTSCKIVVYTNYANGSYPSSPKSC